MKTVHKTLWALLASGLLVTSAFAATSGGLTNDLPRVNFPNGKLISPPHGIPGHPGMGKLPPLKPGNPTCMAIGCNDQPGIKPPVIGDPRPPMPIKPGSPNCLAIGLPCSGQPPVIGGGPRPMPPIKNPDNPFCNGVSVPCGGDKPPVIGGQRPPMPPMPPIKNPDGPFCNGVSVPCGGDKPPVIGGQRPPMPPMPPIGKPPVREPGTVPGNPGIGHPMPRPPMDCPDNAMCAQPMPMPMPPIDGREPGVMLPNGNIEFSKPTHIQETNPMNGVLR